MKITRTFPTSHPLFPFISRTLEIAVNEKELRDYLETNSITSFPTLSKEEIAFIMYGDVKQDLL